MTKNIKKYAVCCRQRVCPYVTFQAILRGRLYPDNLPGRGYIRVMQAVKADSEGAVARHTHGIVEENIGAFDFTDRPVKPPVQYLTLEAWVPYRRCVIIVFYPFNFACYLFPYSPSFIINTT